MYKVRIKKKCGGKTHMAEGGTSEMMPHISTSMGAVPREEANIEVEKGESAFGDINGDSFAELMFFGGKRHHSGGTPVNVPPGTFIFSDTKKLKIKDPELLTKFFNIKNPRKKGYTPAEISYQYKDFNKYMDTLKKGDDADQIKIGTATEMVDNIKNKLGALALIQESMKGFPDGIPSFAESAVAALGIDPQEIISKTQPQQPAQGQPQQTLEGQPESMPLMGEAQNGGMQMQMSSLGKFLPQHQTGGMNKALSKGTGAMNAAMMAAGDADKKDVDDSKGKWTVDENGVWTQMADDYVPSEPTKVTVDYPTKAGKYSYNNKRYDYNPNNNAWQIEVSPGKWEPLTAGDVNMRINTLNQWAKPESASETYSYRKINEYKSNPTYQNTFDYTDEQWEALRKGIEDKGYTNDTQYKWNDPYGTAYKGQGFSGDISKYHDFMDALAEGEDKYGNTIGKEGARDLWDDYVQAFETGSASKISAIQNTFMELDVAGLSWMPASHQDKLDDLYAILDERVTDIDNKKKEAAHNRTANTARQDYQKLLMLKKFKLEHLPEGESSFQLKSEIKEMQKNLNTYPSGVGKLKEIDRSLHSIRETGQFNTGDTKYKYTPYDWTSGKLAGYSTKKQIDKELKNLETEGFKFVHSTGSSDPVKKKEDGLIDFWSIGSLDELNKLYDSRQTNSVQEETTPVSPQTNTNTQSSYINSSELEVEDF
jgi:hypothetical protein